MYQIGLFLLAVLAGVLPFAVPQACGQALREGLALCAGPLLLSLFPFLVVLGGIFDALYAGRTFTLHGIRRYVAKLQKVTRSRASATRYCKSRNDAIHTRKRKTHHESVKH